VIAPKIAPKVGRGDPARAQADGVLAPALELVKLTKVCANGTVACDDVSLAVARSKTDGHPVTGDA